MESKNVKHSNFSLLDSGSTNLIARQELQNLTKPLPNPPVEQLTIAQLPFVV
jgi:Ca2+-binding EF-hand superfamily protein